jgi:hypothetical protein
LIAGPKGRIVTGAEAGAMAPPRLQAMRRVAHGALANGEEKEVRHVCPAHCR